ncbi:hemerythrin HHE cation binding domain-containing protein [Trichoderma gamsii]|uniref:Hemerythrin HHE cation binding domain-containing protein n=1 Tax=Trichoderma gamsii TaxID=398673 RepID=A0A2P5A0K0_9HYPO|nr:hemerythrin HHE cation binding domain-containing protein [Trichoderma gamsii]PON30075.1 hemerythrin HHE cation binding domain-containing protein [Trichoderma gamsii]
MASAEGNSSRPWADGPFELIPIALLGYKPGEKVEPYHAMGLEMVTVHNCLIRGINSIYLQCINVERSSASIPAFIKYASVWGRVLSLHHTTEEKWIFPEIEEITGERGIMDASVQQHHAFEEGVKAYTDYLKNADIGEEKYDGAKLKTIIDSFMPSLRQHLQDEILTLKGFDKYKDKTDWAKWTKDTIAKVVKKTQTADGMVVELPFGVHNHDVEYEQIGSWPPVPAIVFFIIKFLYFGKNSDWWQFAPCDKNGKARDLPYSL